MLKTFEDRAATLDSPAEARAFYDDWAATYDAERAEQGYATPVRAARLLAARTADRTAPILDLGCGTGIAGAAFRAAGFATVDGLDLSPAMLAGARAKGVYRALAEGDAARPLASPRGQYAAIAAIGLLDPGHAPPVTIDHALRALDRGGRFVFSLSDSTRAVPAYEGRVREWVDAGAARVEAREKGDHLPELGLSALVYVLCRC